MCTILGHFLHMMYGSWDIECGRQNFLSFWTIFCPLTLLNTQRIKILKNEKNTGDIIILYLCTKYHNIIICYGVPEKGRVTDIIFIFHVWLFFALLRPQSTLSRKIKMHLKCTKIKLFKYMQFTCFTLSKYQEN